ncbi:MAG: GP88 family protein [Planctomycetota bacterium]
MPVVTCVPGVPCSIPDDTGRPPCYALHMLAGPYGARIRDAWQRNTDILNASQSEFFSQLHGYLTRRRPEYFRFHIAGDYVNTEHLNRAFQTARLFENTRFLSFSKRFEFFPAASTVPRNFTLVASLWPGFATRPRGYRVAFMQDGREHRVTPAALRCLGNCETCGFCWNLRTLRRDVVFQKH